jgi:glycosyltransferase involved in cell wall biosynthesis
VGAHRRRAVDRARRGAPLIAFVHGLRNWGAVEEYVAAVVRGLRERGEDVALLYPRASVLAPFGELDATTETFDLDAPGLTRGLARRLRALRPRLVHATDVFPQAQLAARVAGVRRLVVTHHTPELPRHDSAVGRLWQSIGWATRPEVIYTSDTDRANDRFRALRTHVVPLGIDLERFARGTPALDGRLVGNVARLAQQKGQRDLIAAAPKVLERHPDVRFVIAGEGELREELAELAAPFGDRVGLLGARDDVPDLLASLDVFAFPSRFEGLCLAVIEAQAAGVPVVATPVGGIRETVVDGETGWLVQPHDIDALAERISWCLDHPDEARAVAAEAQRRVRERFSTERMVAETLAVYGIS